MPANKKGTKTRNGMVLKFSFFTIGLILLVVIVYGLALVRTEFFPSASLNSNLPKRLLETGCNNFSFPNNKRVFSQNELIPVTYTDPAKPHSVKLYFSDTFQPTPNWNQGNNLMDWKEIPGTYSKETGVFQGSISYRPPNSGGKTELLLVANVQATEGGQICSGNPIFPDAPNGVLATAGKEACNGCHTYIVIDDNLSVTTHSEDLALYWNLNPGNYWKYEGVNTSWSPQKTFSTRIDIENSISLCGFNSNPMRFTKDSIHGYWGPRYSWQGDNAWNGPYSRRWFPTAFLNDDNWSGSNFMGSVGAKSYTSDGGAEEFRKLGSFYPLNQVIFASKAQNYFFPPYFLSPRNFDFSNGSEYIFERFDKIYTPWAKDRVADDNICGRLPNSLVNTRNGSGIEKVHGWRVDIKPVTVTTPFYSGQALRYRFIEYQYPMGSGFILREDWYVAKGIGLVRADAKDISHHFMGSQALTMEKCRTTPMCLGADVFDGPTGQNMPDATMHLVAHFSAKPLTATASKPPDGGTTARAISTTPGEKWLINLSDNYTGWVDTRTSTDQNNWTITEKWAWAENGVIERTAQPVNPGNYYAQFRPHTLDTPSAYEVQLSNSDQPWSNEIVNTSQPQVQPQIESGQGSNQPSQQAPTTPTETPVKAQIKIIK